VSRIGSFTFRVTPEERRLIGVVAERLDRTDSDTVRWLIREAARARGLLPQPAVKTNGAPPVLTPEGAARG
jgi:hypothetical protein